MAVRFVEDDSAICVLAELEERLVLSIGNSQSVDDGAVGILGDVGSDLLSECQSSLVL